jgi:4-hydroxy-tetrahydrodipicolinate synthase
MKSGCYTAIVTPFKDGAVDEEGLANLVDYQINNGVTGILAVGTTGESPTLNWKEHNRVVESVARMSKGKCLCIAGTGSNNTQECLEASEHAAKEGVDALLLVDPYYNGPSSLEIRKEYVAPVATHFPDITVIPYVIPGRTGAQLLPEDLALLFQEYKNVDTVKEATGNLDNMRRTRECCGPDFTILSGDDGLTFEMMTDPAIGAAGAISVISNVAPKAVSEMVECIKSGDQDGAAKLRDALNPLFNLVMVKTMEDTPFGEALFRARNPLPIKSLMTILGMPAGSCRRPLGKMTPKSLAIVLEAARKVQNDNPEIFTPLAEHFSVDVEACLSGEPFLEELCYDSY